MVCLLSSHHGCSATAPHGRPPLVVPPPGARRGGGSGVGVGADGLVAVLEGHELAAQRVVGLLQAAVVLLRLVQLRAQHLHV